MNKNIEEILGLALALVFLGACLWLLGDLTNYSGRMAEHDRHYCIAIEGNTLEECEAMGR